MGIILSVVNFLVVENDLDQEIIHNLVDSYQQEGSNILNVVPRDEIKIADKENVKIYEVIDFVIHKKVKDIIHDVN